MQVDFIGRAGDAQRGRIVAAQRDKKRTLSGRTLKEKKKNCITIQESCTSELMATILLFISNDFSSQHNFENKKSVCVRDHVQLDVHKTKWTSI